MTTRTAPTAETHPYRVGKVVYRTLEDAEAAIERAHETYAGQPDWAMSLAAMEVRNFDGTRRAAR